METVIRYVRYLCSPLIRPLVKLNSTSFRRHGSPLLSVPTSSDSDSSLTHPLTVPFYPPPPTTSPYTVRGTPPLVFGFPLLSLMLLVPVTGSPVPPLTDHRLSYPFYIPSWFRSLSCSNTEESKGPQERTTPSPVASPTQIVGRRVYRVLEKTPGRSGLVHVS